MSSKTSTISLTEPQVNVLRLMVDANDNGGVMSVRKINEHFGWASPNAAHRHIRALAGKGLLELRGAGEPARITKLAMSLYSKRAPLKRTTKRKAN